MNQMIGNVQDRIKTSSFDIFTFIIKLFSGFMLGLTLALIGQEIIGYGTFSFVFAIVVILGSFLRIVKNWKLVSVLLFDAFCILLGFLLKMYILVAPGA